MKKERILPIFTRICLLVTLASLLILAACTSQSSQVSQPSATMSTQSSKPTSTTTVAGKYSPPCKVLTAEDIASVLGVSASDITEQPSQPKDAGCIEQFIVKMGATPTAVVSVALTDTKASTIYNAEPKVCLANTKKMVAASQPSLGIGDYDSFQMVGGAIMFGKGKYMVQVTCPMGIAIEKTIAIAKLVAKHI